jgi:predicted DNA-binding protein (MmcQ/YjbR family)
VTDTDATLARLPAICLSLPDSRMSTSWGKPHVTVGGKVFAAVDEIEGAATLSIKLAATTLTSGWPPIRGYGHQGIGAAWRC